MHGLLPAIPRKMTYLGRQKTLRTAVNADEVLPSQGCLTRQTWRFGRRFRTRTDGQTCPSVLFRRTSACKKFFTIFFFTLGNFSEADVSNQNPRWRRARADGCARAQTGKGAHRRVRAGADVCARPYSSTRARRRFHPSAYVCQKNGSQWVVHRDCSSSGWII